MQNNAIVQQASIISFNPNCSHRKYKIPPSFHSPRLFFCLTPLFFPPEEHKPPHLCPISESPSFHPPWRWPKWMNRWEKGWEGGMVTDKRSCVISPHPAICFDRGSVCVLQLVCARSHRCVQVCILTLCVHLRSTHSFLLTRSPLQTAREAHLVAWFVPGEVLWPGQGVQGPVCWGVGFRSAWSFPLSKSNRRGRWRRGHSDLHWV